MNYKYREDDFDHNEHTNEIEKNRIKNEIFQEISNIYKPEMFESFSDEFGTICMNIINAYDQGDPSAVLENLIEANSFHQNELKDFYQNAELIENIKSVNIIPTIFDLAFTNDNEPVNLEEEDLDNDLIEASDFINPETEEINNKVVYNSLVFLLFMSAFSRDLSNHISSFNFWEKFFNAFDWYSPECIKIGLLIGTNIIIDATPSMLLEFNRKDQINQRLIDIVVNDTFPDNISEKITEETSLLASQMLYYFNYIGNEFDNRYIRYYADAICRVINYTSDNSRVFLIRSLNALLQKRSSKDFEFLFQHHPDSNPIIDDLLKNITFDFVPLRKEIVRLIRFGACSEDISIGDKETMIDNIDFETLNSIILSFPDDNSDILSLIYDFSTLGQQIATKLFNYNVYFTLTEHFDEFPFQNRLQILKLFCYLVKKSNTEFINLLFEIKTMQIFISMLGNSKSIDDEILFTLNIFLFKVNQTYHDRMIEEAKEVDAAEILLQLEPSDELLEILKILEIPLPENDK